MKRLALPVIIVIAVLITGCGRGGSATAVPTGSVIRQLKPGDKLIYDVSANVGDTQWRGTSVLTVQDANIHVGKGLRVLKKVFSLKPNGGRNVQTLKTDYLAQTSDGRLYFAGYQHKGHDVLIKNVRAVPFFPSPMRVGQTFCGTAEYSHGSMGTATGRVDRLEPVDGRMAYRVSITMEYVDGCHVRATDWFVPDLGYCIKSLSTVQRPGKPRYDDVMIMRSKNF
jgi:hypothetical protein